MSSDAIASGRPLCVNWLTSSPAAAKTRPINAAESSTTIARTIGSLDRMRWKESEWFRSRASSLACPTLCTHEMPSAMNATPRTIHAASVCFVTAGCVSS